MMTPQQKNFVNQRASARYRMVTTLRYRAFRQAAVTCSGSGQTIDMSSGGIAIEIGRVLDPGTEMELVLDWTGLYHGKRKMRLFIWGEVVRSEEQSTAVRILSHEFREVSSRAVA
ncbi:MAG TPA: PilZ domain-containing protein [Candidatus Acidoferrum sp.]|nr:PilZ domain-containing protein [Candidatus Acidoferrum sp.]